MKLTASPSGPLSGLAAIPPDKSISHRALILGSLADGQTSIEGLLEADDVLRTVEAMVTLVRADQNCFTARSAERGRHASPEEKGSQWHLKRSNGSRQVLQRHCALHGVEPKRLTSSVSRDPHSGHSALAEGSGGAMP